MRQTLFILLIFIIISCNQQKSKQESSSAIENYTEINKQGVINTFVDGVEVGQVNIWESNKNKDRIIAICKKNEPVTVLVSDGTYYKIKTYEGKEGWLMHGFIVLKE